MLYSMTGYGEAAIEEERIRAGFRIKTVNNKGLDLSIKLPFDFMYMEPELRNILKEKFFRGRVDVFSEIEVLDADICPPTPLNQTRLNQIMRFCNQMKDEFQVAGAIDVNTLIRLPDLTLTRRVGFRLPEAMERVVLDALREAIAQVQRSRALEGRKLSEDIIPRLAALQADVRELEEFTVQRHQEIKEQILKRVRALMDDAQLDELRLNQEVVYYADRLDITEEITRLKAHLTTMTNLLQADKRPLGKELDFMVQEQMREVSTIGNKAKHKKISNKVVALKTGYEKIREQIQNTE